MPAVPETSETREELICQTLNRLYPDLPNIPKGDASQRDKLVSEAYFFDGGKCAKVLGIKYTPLGQVSGGHGEVSQGEVWPVRIGVRGMRALYLQMTGLEWVGMSPSAIEGYARRLLQAGHAKPSGPILRISSVGAPVRLSLSSSDASPHACPQPVCRGVP